MNIDFPLILVIVVLGSGAIWLLDSLLLARGRATRRLQLAEQFPGYDQAGSKASQAFAEACDREASEPAVVEYARSLFPVLGGRIGACVLFCTSPSRFHHHQWCLPSRWATTFL
jgi:signal peptidase I